jgi:dipeptidyl aminopeptidase/acylaminoacyl peptidase
MSQRDPFDAALAGWLEDEAAGMAPPDLHAGAMRAARRASQRPTWLVAVRGGLDAGPRVAGRLVPARTILVVLALLLLAAVLVVAAGRLLNNEPLFGVANGRILVARETTGEGAEYVTVQPDGTGALSFMQADDCDQCAFWSPDGRRIMIPFVAADGRLGTAIIDPDGSSRVEILSPEGTLFLGPGTWSADSRQIALEGFDPNDPNRPEAGIYVASADGSDLRQVTSSTDGRPHVFPALSPDGRHLAYLAQDAEKPIIGTAAGDLFVINLDGTGRRSINPAGTKVVATGTTGRPVDWSPDGQELLFAAMEGGQEVGQSAAYLIDAEGGQATQISGDGTWLISVEWSPDGAWLLYGEVDSANAPTWVTRADGTEGRQLTGPGTPVEGCCATWSPDSSRLLFLRPANGGSDLWTMDLNGALLDQITNDPGEYMWYSWVRQP